MKKIVSPLLISAVLICLGYFAYGYLHHGNCKQAVTTENASTLDKIVQRGVIKVGMTGDFVPFSYTFKNKPSEFRGVDVELAQDLAKALGVEVEFVQTSWPTLISDLLADKFDIGMSGITIKLNRQKDILFSTPILASGKAAITRDELADRFKTLEDINQPDVRVIFNPGGTNEAFALANFPNAQHILNKDNITIFGRIAKGEADVMVTDAVETLLQQQIHPGLEAVNPDDPFNFFEMGYIMNRDHTLKAFVDQWVNLRKKDGTFQTLFDAGLENVVRDKELIH